MTEYLMLMHDMTVTDGVAPADPDWGPYIAGLQSSGVMRGGSAIGSGVCVRKAGDAPPVTAHIGGYIRIEAETLAEARALLAGNPVYEAGGVVEIRELPRTD